jgi:undecaprenyl-diphosphatase
MSFFIHLDQTVFQFLNHAFANRFLDWLMPVITEEDNWKIPILLIWLSLMIFGGKRGRITALLLIPVIVLSDQVVNFVIKPWAGRVRPCFALENVRCLLAQPHSPSFPSSHAANMAAAASLFSLQYRRYTWGFVFMALLIGYSRIYVGVHYPSDVLAGWCVGVIDALLVFAAWKKTEAFIQKRKGERNHGKAIRKDLDRTGRRGHHRVAGGRRR